MTEQGRFCWNASLPNGYSMPTLILNPTASTEEQPDSALTEAKC